MSNMDRMQEINVDFSQFIKKNLKKIKMLPKDKQKEFGRLLGDFKEGLDNLSESNVNEGLNKSDVSYQLAIDYTGRTKPKITKLNKKKLEVKYGYKVNAESVIDSIKSLYPEVELKHIEWRETMSGGGVHSFAIKESEGVNESSVNEAKVAFINDKLIGDRIQKSGLLPLLGDNNASLNSDKVKFTRALSDTLKKLYKKHSSLPIK